MHTKQRRAAEIQNAECTWKEDWKGNDLVACVQILRSFVAAQTVFQHLVEPHSTASLVPASSTVLDFYSVFQFDFFPNIIQIHVQTHKFFFMDMVVSTSSDAGCHLELSK